MPRRAMPRQTLGGLTLLEVVVTIAILIALAGILVPIVGHLVRDAQASRIVDLAERLKGACHRYWIDTAEFASEYGGADQALYSDPARHKLSMDTGSTDWKGPYIDAPLSLKASPTGGGVELVNALSAMPSFPGFVLPGDATPRNDAGNMLVFEEIPMGLAEAVNDKVEPSETADRWMPEGRVAYAASEERLYVFLLSGKNVGSKVQQAPEGSLTK